MSLADFQTRLLLAIHGINDEDLHRPESEGKWSVAQVIAHLAQFEMIVAVRLRTVIAGNTPNLVAFDQNRWMENVYRGEPVAELLEQVWFHRRMNLAFLGRLRDDELDLAGIHPDYGHNTLRELVARLERHQEKHLGQIERIKSTHGLAASSAPDVTRVVAGALRAERSPGPGVHVREIWADGVKRALEVDFDPGAQWPGIDYHVPGPEEVYVLSGDFDDGANTYGAGTFLHHPAGSSHQPRSTAGCRLFVFYPEG